MIEKWYDICCNICYSHLSTDYGTGESRSKDTIINWAIKKGWIIKSSKTTICPKCKQK